MENEKMSMDMMLEQHFEELNKRIAENPQDAVAYFDRASMYSGIKHQPEKAIEDLKKAIELKPDWHSAYYNLAHVYSDMGNNEEAVKNYDKAIECCDKVGLSKDDANRWACEHNKSLILKEMQNKK